jgi:hypothetical protein
VRSGRYVEVESWRSRGLKSVVVEVEGSDVYGLNTKAICLEDSKSDIRIVFEVLFCIIDTSIDWSMAGSF